ncbi:hypothetical protein [Bacillus phage CM1]|nr:hypothetical protein [Bacillus phage CM1]
MNFKNIIMRGRQGKSVINGKTYVGNNITISNGVVIVDGVVQEGSLGDKLEITVLCNVDKIESEQSITIKGDVTGNIQAGSSVSCNDVTGSVQAGSSISCDDIGGDARAGSSISCDDIKGNAYANIISR